MNKFKCLSTVITKSELDFTRIKNATSFNGDADLSVMVSVPKIIEAEKPIACTAKFTLGGDDEVVKIFVESMSRFKITEVIDPNTLNEDAKEVCRRITIEEMIKKIADLTKLHTGKPLNIPMPKEL